MKRWKIWTSIAVIFVSGLLMGSAGTAVYIRHVLLRIVDGGPPEVRRVVMRRLARELRLTAGQREEVEKVVRKTQERLIKIRLENEPVVARIVQEGAGEMKEHLDGRQQKKLDGLLERLRERLMLSAKQGPEIRERGAD